MAIDIAGMLTGVSRQQGIDPNLSMDQRALARGAQYGQLMQGGINSMRQSAGAPPTTEQQLASSMAKLDLTTEKDLIKLGKLMQATGDMKGAAQVAAKIEAIRKEGKTLKSTTERQANFLKYITKEYPQLVELASGESPVLTPANFKSFLSSGGTLTTDQKEFAQAKLEGFKGTLEQWQDRNLSTTGTDSRTADQKEFAQAQLEGFKGTFTEYKDRNISTAEPDTRTSDQKEFDQAKEEGFEGTFTEYQDRNISKAEPDTRTPAQKELAQVNQENLIAGKPAILMEDYLKNIGTIEGKVVDNIIKVVDPTTGVENHVGIDNKGGTTTVLGISQLPTHTAVDNLDGTTTITNDVTGTSITKPTTETPEAAALRQTKTAQSLAEINATLLKINKARELVDEGGAGWEYSFLDYVPLGTDSRKLSSIVTSLNSNLAFKRLQDMRDASKTGGALGSIAVQELLLLQGALESLDPTSGAEYFNGQLDNIEGHYKNYAKALTGVLPSLDYNSSIFSNYSQITKKTDKNYKMVYYRDPMTGVVTPLGKTDIMDKRSK